MYCGVDYLDILWEEKSDYKLLDSKRYHINETCGRSDLFIPYERKYSTLNEEQLLCLICAAKQNRWQALDLTSCGLTWLPDELWDLPDLQMLFLGNRERHNRNEQSRFNDTTNMISVLSRNIEALKNLRVLSLAGNSITIEGESTLNLPRLRHLDIFDCDLPQVPNALLIPSLEEIGFNCLEEHLADNFANLRKLKRIYLSHSKIVDLPEYIGTFYSLQHLYLFGSKVSSLPNAIGQLRHLSRIEMYNTPLAEALPPEILKQSAREIIRYVLSQQSNAQKEFFNESKMVIVGQGHVGKSSLLNRLINNSYSDGGSTEGIDISSWFFTQDGQPYRLNVWDFGGQEIYHSTHQFFLTKRSLYLLVWDALAEVEYGRIDYWLKTIQSLAADSPIIIVVNKCDRGIGRIGRIDAGDYMDRYPQIKEVVYVSCKDNIGITELRSTIQSLAVDLPLMKTSWLSSWMAVRNHLEVLTKKINFIPYTEYLGICKAEGIEVDEAKSLIKYLHDLGIVLYYHDDPLLKNLVILSSEWGTDAVYKVLDEQERQLKGRNGILYYDDLPLIWNDDNRYPQDRYPYLLNLMKKFQLAFEITPSSFLVAELLDNKIINCDRNFPFGETLSFRYQYDCSGSAEIAN